MEYGSVNPTLPPAKQITNRESLTRECGDILAAIEIMAKAGEISLSEVVMARDDKMLRVAAFLHEQ